MAIEVTAIPRDELDVIAQRFADTASALLLDTLAEGFGEAPDAVVVAAGWMDAFKRSPRPPAPADLASMRTLWARRVTALTARIRQVYGRSVLSVRDQLVPAVAEPPDWRDRLGGGRSAAPDWQTLVTEGMPVVPPEAADPIMDVVWRNLTNLGDQLFDEVAAEIQEGARAGESVEAITLRVQRVVGNAEWRARRIARTEMNRASNNASLAEMLFSGLNGHKMWVANEDNRTRPTHHEADGQTVELAETFDVGGFPLLYPGDPAGPPQETINCRCDLTHVVPTEQTPDWASNLGAGPVSPRAGEWPPDNLEEWMTDPVPDNPAFLPFEELTASAEDVELQSRMPAKLQEYWLAGPGAAKIRWGTPGSFDRCVKELSPKFPADPKGLCANLYHEATGTWPGAKKGGHALAASADVNTGAMVALVPSAADAARLAVDGGEPIDQLHCTLMYLGDAADYSTIARDSIVERVESHPFTAPTTADAFSINVFNPGTANERDPCVVMGLSGANLADVHKWVNEALGYELDNKAPAQHEPWIPHVTLAYTDDMSRMAEFADRVGPVTFDHIMVAFGDDYTYVPLGAPAPATVSDPLPDVAPPPLPTLYPEGSFEALITVEGIETGDSRAFMPGSLTVAPGPWWEFNWQKKLEDGHDGAVLVGRLDQIWRTPDGSIMARGCFDVNGEHAQEPMRQIREGFLKGVSVDLDSAVAEQFYDDPNSDEPTFTLYHSARIRGATLVTYPAYVETQIRMTEGTPMEAPEQVTPLVASGEPLSLVAAAVKSHDTATSTAPWDGAAAVKRLPSPMSLDTARNEFAWIDDSMVTDGMVPKSAGKFPHHEVSADGTPGAANLAACSAGIAVLNGGRGGSTIPGADVKGVYAHLARHLKDGKKTPPPLTASLVACGCDVPYEAPTDDMFADPGFTRVTPPTITADGRYFGHGAVWDTCHTGIQGTCRKPPREGDHAYFRLGEVVTASGASIPVGHITMGIGHAPTSAGFSAAAAMEHYDNTSAVVADVASGEDAYGIWFSGRLRPGVTDVQKAALRSAQLSGDWRSFGGKLRLVAMLAVNVPGFPVPRLSTATSGGRQFALVAAGMVGDTADREARSIVMSSLQRRMGRDAATRRNTLLGRVHGEG